VLQLRSINGIVIKPRGTALDEIFRCRRRYDQFAGCNIGLGTFDIATGGPQKQEKKYATPKNFQCSIAFSP
jgi:hypothetical protein